MIAQLRAALVAILAFTLLTGVLYPLAVTGVAQAAMHDKASGSLLEKDGKVVGSRLIGRQWDDPKYFWGRLSATLDSNGKALAYNGGNSAGSNLGPTSQKLIDTISQRVDQMRAANGGGPVPVDLVTTSASGLDPDISPAAAAYQVARVAAARGMSTAAVQALVDKHTEQPLLGFLGEPAVNVLLLNLDLDGLLK